MRVGRADLGDADVRALIAHHQRDMLAVSPPGTSYALDLSSLDRPNVEVFAARDNGQLLCIGALKWLSDTHCEIKSMRVHPKHRSRGAGQRVLDRIIAAARGRGCTRLSLETGTAPAFADAIRLYHRNGFAPGEDFGGYTNGPDNQCLHLEL